MLCLNCSFQNSATRIFFRAVCFWSEISETKEWGLGFLCQKFIFVSVRRSPMAGKREVLRSLDDGSVFIEASLKECLPSGYGRSFVSPWSNNSHLALIPRSRGVKWDTLVVHVTKYRHAAVRLTCPRFIRCGEPPEKNELFYLCQADKIYLFFAYYSLGVSISVPSPSYLVTSLLLAISHSSGSSLSCKKFHGIILTHHINRILLCFWENFYQSLFKNF